MARTLTERVRVRTSDYEAVSDEVLPGIEPDEVVVNGELAVARPSPVWGVVVGPADVEMVTVRVPRSVRHSLGPARPNQTIVQVDAQKGVRMPGVLQEIPIVRLQLGQWHLPPLPVDLEPQVQPSVLVKHIDALVPGGDVVHAFLEFREFDEHGPCVAIGASLQIAKATTAVLTNIHVLVTASQFDCRRYDPRDVPAAAVNWYVQQLVLELVCPDLVHVQDVVKDATCV